MPSTPTAEKRIPKFDADTWIIKQAKVTSTYAPYVDIATVTLCQKNGANIADGRKTTRHQAKQLANFKLMADAPLMLKPLTKLLDQGDLPENDQKIVNKLIQRHYA